MRRFRLPGTHAGLSLELRSNPLALRDQASSAASLSLSQTARRAISSVASFHRYCPSSVHRVLRYGGPATISSLGYRDANGKSHTDDMAGRPSEKPIPVAPQSAKSTEPSGSASPLSANPNVPTMKPPS